jgi:hypothetical protein
MHMRALSRKQDPAWKTVRKEGRLHEVRTTKCGGTETCDLITARWAETTCQKCLERRRFWTKEDLREENRVQQLATATASKELE